MNTETKHKILIVEDDILSMKLFTEQLRGTNLEIRTCTNGVEAYEKALDFHPDIILSDWMMPEMSGEELCKKVKENDGLKLTYFIMITARATSDDIVTGLNIGADDYITKPCNAQELIARINTGLRILSLQQENSAIQRMDAIHQTVITANHEINNPLQTILVAVELIQNQNPGLDKVTLDNLAKISDNTMRISNVMMELSHLIEAVPKEYIRSGPQMIDLKKSTIKDF